MTDTIQEIIPGCENHCDNCNTDTVESLIKCDDCSNKHCPDCMIQVDNYHVCQSCRDENYFTCEKCGAIHHGDQKLDVKQAHAMSALSGRIVQTAELDLKFRRVGIKNSLRKNTRLQKKEQNER